ncbi:MAG: hypothetical protein ACRDP8_01745 [Actinopolymorphaceae bacterium]
MTRRYAATLAFVLLATLPLGGVAGSANASAKPVTGSLTDKEWGRDGGDSTPSPSYTPRPPGGYERGESIGIRLLEAPVSRRNDPRARTSIVDHLNPGTTIHRRIEVSNNSNKNITRRVDVYPGAATVKDHEFVVSAGRKPNELASWISVDRPVLDLPPDSTAIVKVTIEVPETASEGERFAVVWAWTAARPGQTRNVGLASGVGIRVFLDIGPGGEPPSDFRIDGLTPGRTKDGTPQVMARVANTGGRALDMSGTLSLADGPGGFKAGPYPAKVGTVLLPGDSAPVTVRLNPETPNGPWNVRLTLTSGRISHTIKAMVTFPERRGTWGLPVDLESPVPLTATVTGALAAIGGLVLVVVGAHRLRSRVDATRM